MFWSLLLKYTVCTFYRVTEHCSHCGSFIASQARLRQELKVCFPPVVQLISFHNPASKGSQSVAGAVFLCYKTPLLTDTIKCTFCSMPTLIVL